MSQLLQTITGAVLLSEQRPAFRHASAIALLLLLAISTGTSAAATNEAQSWTGAEIMAELDRRHEIAVETISVAMTLIDNKGYETKRKVRELRRRGDDNLLRTLIVIDEPAGVRGTAVLTWEQNGATDDQWTYLPALGRLKRIVGGGKRSYFLGTDFTHEDFEKEDRTEFSYVRLSDQAIDGKPCFVVDAVPASEELKRESGYARKRVYVEQERHVVRRVEFFRRGAEDMIKTLDILEVEKAGESALRPKVSVMTNTDLGHTTRLEVTARDIREEAVPVEAFTPIYLTSHRHLR